MEVFDHCLEMNGIATIQKASLRNAYQQILHDIYHDDSQAE
jgi:exonuclease SbcD